MVTRRVLDPSGAIVPPPSPNDDPQLPDRPERPPLEPPRRLRRTRAHRLGDAVFTAVTRLGIGPAHLLTTRGRRTGRMHTTPVILVERDGGTWLVSPYGQVPWVLNARAAGRVTLSRGRDVRDYAIREVSPTEAGPVLKAYVGVAPAARPYFHAGRQAPVGHFVAEAALHPVFALSPVTAA